VNTENPPAACLRQILLTDGRLGFTRIGGNHV
jgi:hypothetical protein